MPNYIAVSKVSVTGLVSKSTLHETIDEAQARVTELIELGYATSFYTSYYGEPIEWLVADLVNKTVTPDVNGHAALRDSDNWKSLRAERDRRLSACDWCVLPDKPVSQAWMDYRQALRDLPANTVDPANPVWPVEPV